MITPALLVLDVDGTILDEGYLAPERIKAIQAVARTIPTLLSSGRAPESMQKVCHALELYGPHGVTNGGALLSNEHDIEILHALPIGDIHIILTALHERDCVAALYKPGEGIFTTGDHPSFDMLRNLGERNLTHHLPASLEGVVKVLTIVDEPNEGDLRTILADRTTIQRTHEWFLEWNAQGASKGNALLVQAARFGVDPSQVVAVGDSENDISMFMTPAFGVAVRNAHPKVKEAADLVLDMDLTDWLKTLVDH